jgi:hypothetical protein
VTLRTVGGQMSAEDVNDLVRWVTALQGCPSVDRTVVATCRRPAHGDDPATWFYVEADSRQGVARLRCLACGDVRSVLDSADRWTYPSAWSCSNCRQSIAEVVYGIHVEDGAATWLAITVRCVGCGHLDGVADLVVPAVGAEVFAAAL